VIQVVDAVLKQPIAGALLSINVDGMPGRMDRTEAQGRGSSSLLQGLRRRNARVRLKEEVAKAIGKGAQ
jgi:hypothetical protein